jgi:hypothetical protein
MKRCPKCNRTYATNTQRFCTHDGVALLTSDTTQGETIRLDSSPLEANDDEQTRVIDEATKVITPDLVPDATGEFDPFKTVMSRPGPTDAIPSRDTQALPSGTLQSMQPPESGAPTSAALPQLSAPLSPPAAPPDADAQPASPVVPGAASTSAPLPPVPQQVAAAGTVQPPSAKSKLPLVLGILVVLLVLGLGVVGAAYFLAIKPALEKRTATKPEPRPQPSVAATPIVEASPNEPADKKSEPSKYSPPADAVQFMNSSSTLDGKLAEHYVEFSFYYPERWEKDPKSGVAGANNFIEVHRQLPPNFTQESVAVSWYESAGSFEKDQSSFRSLVEAKNAQFAPNIDQYRKVSEGPTKIAGYDGYEFRFEGVSQKTDKGQFKIWGRVVWLPSQSGEKNGVTLLMLATSLAPELKSVGDVGEKGELSMALKSFRFGKN